MATLARPPDPAQVRIRIGTVTASRKGMVATRMRVLAVIGAVVMVSATASAARQMKVSDITMARAVVEGQPVGPSSILPTNAGEIFVWARLEGAVPGTAIQARWFFLGGSVPQSIGDAVVNVPPGAASLSFSMELPSGRAWPEGPYRVELRAGGLVIGECRFTVAAENARYVHPRLRYAFLPPQGWAIDDVDPNDGVRLRAPGGTGLIELQTGSTSVRLEPLSYAAGWQSMAIGAGKLLDAKRGGGTTAIDGFSAYQAVYTGPAVTVKIAFVATADRIFVLTGSFESGVFAQGEAIFDRFIESLRLLPR